MRKALAGFVLGFVLAGALALPVAQTVYQGAVWPVAGTTLSTANRTVRERLFANRTYYVRTDGHDSNCDGLTAASDASTSTTNCGFLTIQKAVDVVYGALDLSIYDVTIDVEDGTYTGAVVIDAPHVGLGGVTIQGNSGTPANVVISTTSASAFTVSQNAVVTIKDLKVQTTTSGSGFDVLTGAIANIGNVNLGTIVTYGVSANGGTVVLLSSYTVSGSATAHLLAVRGGTIRGTVGITITYSGTPAFSLANIYASGAASIRLVSVTHTGAATGKQFDASLESAIDTGGTTLPGSTVGTTDRREILTAARTYYVRTDGHDSNCDGKTDASDASTSTTACAVLTPQKAVDLAFALDTNGYAVTVQIRDGTYTTGILVPAGAILVGNGSVTVQGNSSTPTNVVISTTSASAVSVQGSALTVKDFKVTTTTSGFGVASFYGALVNLSGIDFGSTVNAQMRIVDGGRITCTGNYTISGGGPAHFQAYQAGVIRCDNRTITSSGTFSYSAAFAEVAYAGILQASGITFTGGTITGTRYSVYANGIANTGGCTASYFPGNAAGSTATGGLCL